MGRMRVGAWLVAVMAMAMTGCHGRSEIEKGPPIEKSDEDFIASINLSAGAPENPISDGFFPAPKGYSYPSLVRTLTQLQGESHLKGVLIKMRSQSFRFAQAEELGELLRGLRKKGVPVVCHGHELDNSTYWLLRRGCSELWVSAAGGVPTVGIGAELSYLKGALDKVGVRFDMLAMGRYKSGGEALTRSEPSEDSLRNLKSTLSDLRDEWLSGIMSEQDNGQRLAELVEDGPYSPAMAKNLGLIDQVGFEDEAIASLRTQTQVDAIEDVFGPGTDVQREAPIAELVRVLSGAGDRNNKRPRIALVPAVGSITMNAEGPFGGASGITAAAMTRTLRKLRADDSVRAIVMRMDSPGGSPLASDLIWREMMLTRKKKPVIVSIAGMSASGGYYIASGATKIVSSKTAIVGSIGVFGGKVVLSQAAENLGINHLGVAPAPQEGAEARALHMSPLTPWDEATRERVRQTMRGIYDLFIERVAEGRGMDPERVLATAEGEIFLAPTGVDRGLVDELGGLARAIEIARAAADLGESTPVVIEGVQDTLIETLFLGEQPEAHEVQAALRRFEQARLAEVARWSFGESFDRLQPFKAALTPLLAGEQVIAALPFTLQLH